MLDKSKLGRRYVCHECGTKYYDLNRPSAKCPECEADPDEAPARDIASILAKNSMGHTARRVKEPVEQEEPKEAESTDEDIDDIDDIDGFGELEMDEDS
jgi:uncharacterized protein (TIGR02300 family)